ncbi:NAD(P)H-dependent flavin oxidoreductase YrpB, nitropropane dioxygenase family [Anaerosphaera aminiphila DSM 21120]|uniref:Probable nitronate monooxygenase n=1 Tax=Anaerosphaera aminiphila DSM 21120 TaxID=1120995 RepID=A0A1M5U1D3_9FIRM|nr:nitronate monooxygenase family protein [Anaerosphaera aminiphila]SHH56768.1 NAD(P)H-dependent flavin oxidoreductase YrpB, nitropropane dioxygenase family [Anaerosphaera aminiphila DSM 21120]
MCSINFGSKVMDIPIIQGGMGVGVSLGNLSGSVAREGGMGVISAVGIGFREEGYLENSIEKNKIALKKEIDKAKDISEGRGLLAVNVMTAIKDFEEMVKSSSEFGADAVICGAGLPLNLPELVGEETLIAPIVSSKRALDLIVRTWKKRYNRYPDFVVVEGPKAGGHLGFKENEIRELKLEDIVLEISAYLTDLEAETNKKIYLFAAGGIRNNEDRLKMKKLGADGVQVATPFIATEECDVSIEFKEAIVNAKDSDLEIIHSPAGFLARAVKNDFLDSVDYSDVPKRRCIDCLKTCDPRKTPYCISKALSNSAKGRLNVVFSGENINGIDKITTVKEVIKTLMEEK